MSKYWEKTVEYAFVIDAAKNDRITLALPLSGTVERMAGDAIFGNEARLVLVEFKREKAQVDSELDIFTDYTGAKHALGMRDNHHFLVYPIDSKQAGSTPSLIAETYFSRRRCANSFDCLARGVQPSVFKDYLKILFTFKVPDGRSSGGQGGTGVFAHVLGVSEDGRLVQATSLQDYLDHFAPDPEVEAEINGQPPRARNGPK